MLKRHNQPSLRIDAVVSACLDRCLAGPKTPLATLADCLADLDESPDWKRDEIAVVRAEVFRLLQTDERRRKASRISQPLLMFLEA